jgi:hypothetical protein
MAETRLDLSKVTFEDVLDSTSKTPLPSKKQDDIVIPQKEEDGDEPDEVPVDNTDNNNDNADSESFYENLQKILGYEIEGEFDESVEGVAEYTKAIGQKIAEEEVRDLFDSFPDVKEYLQFRLNNGDPAKYFESKYADPDFSTYTITENDEVTQEVVARKYLTQEGYQADQINEMIKDYKDTNLLYKQAKRFNERLVESQKTKREEVLSKQAESARMAEQQRMEMVAEINQVIDKGTLHNLVIPDKDRKEFRAWLLQPDAKGQTRRQSTMSQMSLAQKLELEYLAFKGFDLKDLIRKEANQTKINFLKNGAANKGSRLAGTGGAKVNKPGALGNIKLSDIL